MDAASEQDERDEIVRGFIIEKDYINQEHQKEKEDIVDSFIQEREELIDKFNKKVAEIEQKFNKTQINTSKYEIKPKPMGKYSGKQEAPFYLNLGGENLTAEDFLSNFQLEEKHDKEQDGLERNCRNEKRNMREKLDIECEKKLHYQKFKYESTIEDFKRIVKDLKFEKDYLEKEYKKNTEDWQSLFEERARSLETKHLMEQNNLRDSLEVKHSNAMAKQRDNYERMINELKEDHRMAKELMNEREKEITGIFEKRNEDELKRKNELREKMRQEFQIEFDKILNEKTRISQQVEVLMEEKKQLSDKIKEFNDSKMYKIEIIDEFSNRLNKEYEERLKKSILENEKLNTKIEQLQDENARQLSGLKSFEKEFHLLEDKIISRDKLIGGFEEKISCLREENSQLSNEISSLRKEFSESRGLVENYCELERLLNTKLAGKCIENEKALDRCKNLEREKHDMERKVSILNDDLNDRKSEIELLKRSLKQSEENILTSERLLSEERKENDRFIDRFRFDAGEIRKKENNIVALKEKLRNIEMKVEQDIDNDAEKIDKVMHLEAQNADLRNEIFELKERQHDLLREERELIQKQFAKEFAKRLQSLRRNYEEAIDGLIKQIRELRQRIRELETSIQIKGNQWESKGAILNNDYRHAVQFQNDYENTKPACRERLHNDAVCDCGQSTSLPNKDIQFEYQVPVQDNDLLKNTANSAAQSRRFMRRSDDSLRQCTEHDKPTATRERHGDVNWDIRAESYDQKQTRPILACYSSLPPLDKRTQSRKFHTSHSPNSSSHLRSGYQLANSHESETEKLEKSVDKLQKRLETSHSQMMQRIDSIQNSKGEDNCSDQNDEQPTQKTRKSDDNLHYLLQDLKSDVSHFSKLIDKQKDPEVLDCHPRAALINKNDVTATSLTAYDVEVASCKDLDRIAKSDNNGRETSHEGKEGTEFSNSTIVQGVNGLEISGNEAKIARRYATDLKHQLDETQIELNDTTGALMIVYENQDKMISEQLVKNRISSLSDKKSNELIYEKEMDDKKGLLIDKLIEKLQEKLLDNSKANIKNKDCYENKDSSCDYMLV